MQTIIKMLSTFLSLILLLTSILIPSAYSLISYDISSDVSVEIPAKIVDPDTASFISTVIRAAMTQLFKGNADRDAMKNALSAIPVIDDLTLFSVTEKSNPDINKLVTASENSAEGNLFNFIITGVNDFKLVFIPTEFDGIYEFAGIYKTYEGIEKSIKSSVFFDVDNGVLYGHDNSGIFGIGFDYNAYEYLVTGSIKSWSRNVGYSKLYDITAPIVGIYFDTERITFECGGQQWLVQLWKGNYSRSNGAEIGLYKKNTSLFPEYLTITDNELVTMSLKLYHNDDLLLSLKPQKHWWLNGFAYGPTYKISELTLNGSIEFNSRDMCNAFVAALKLPEHSDISYQVSENTVSFIY